MNPIQTHAPVEQKEDITSELYKILQQTTENNEKL